MQELEDVHSIAQRILQELGTASEPPAKTPRNYGVFTIIMLVLGSPVWLPLLLAAGIVVLAVYVVVWALVITLFAVVLALGIAGVAGIFSLFVYWKSHFISGLFLLGVGLFCAGGAIALFFPICAAAGSILSGTAGFGRWVWGKLFRRGGKGEAA